MGNRSEMNSVRACARRVCEKMPGNDDITSFDLEEIEKFIVEIAKIRAKTRKTTSRKELQILTADPNLVFSIFVEQ